MNQTEKDYREVAKSKGELCPSRIGTTWNGDMICNQCPIRNHLTDPNCSYDESYRIAKTQLKIIELKKKKLKEILA